MATRDEEADLSDYDRERLEKAKRRALNLPREIVLGGVTNVVPKDPKEKEEWSNLLKRKIPK